MKTLNVEDGTWETVMRLKLDLKLSSQDEVIQVLLVRSKILEIKAR
jgi:hypothetical protein